MKNKKLFITVIVTIFVIISMFAVACKPSYIRNNAFLHDEKNFLQKSTREFEDKEGIKSLDPSKKNEWERYINKSYIKNADSYLKTPTPDRTNQANHPDVLYFKDGFHGYKYYMAYTPYAYSNDRVENPCILVSNDGVNFKHQKV